MDSFHSLLTEGMYPTLAVESPSFNTEEEFILFDNDFANQFLTSIDDADDETHSRRTTAEQLILELEQEVKNEPSWLDTVPFLDTLDEPVSPSIFVDELESPKNTEELLYEFDAVCNAIGLAPTPPTSPPTEFLEGAPIYYVIQGEEVDAEMLLDNDSDDSNDFIDELVRSHSSSIPDDISESTSQMSSSPRSDISSPRSESSFDVSGFDDEWTPAVSAPPKRKKRPYGRPIEEKKVRKKEQNKNAATRYRQKKKEQLEVVLQEEEGLKAVHRELQTKFDDTKREINYLKKLMREILVAKGVSI